MNIKDIQKNQQKLIDQKAIEFDNKHTSRKYKIAFSNFNMFLENNSIQEINDENVNDIILAYMKHLKQQTTLTNNTIKQYMILINNLLRNKCKFTIENIKLPKAEKPKPKYINSNQYQEVMQHLELQISLTSDKQQIKTLKMDKLIIQLIFNTGLRIHEVLKITIDDVLELKQDKNNIYQLDIIGKGNKQRTIFIASDVYNAIIEFVQEYAMPGNIYIFESSKAPGNAITTRTIERHFQRIAKELDDIHDAIPGDAAGDNYQELLKPHNLRHSFAVVKLEKGISINAMQELLGHSNITTTQIYTKLNNDSLSDAVLKTI